MSQNYFAQGLNGFYSFTLQIFNKHEYFCIFVTKYSRFITINARAVKLKGKKNTFMLIFLKNNSQLIQKSPDLNISTINLSMGTCPMVLLKKMSSITFEETVCNSGRSSNSLPKRNGCEG